MRVKILSRIWQLVWVPKGETVAARKPKGLAGHDPRWSGLTKSEDGMTESPSLKKKRMFIRSGLPEKDELETIIHECLHAADWSKDEEWVGEAAEDIARILWKQGWRKSNGTA